MRGLLSLMLAIPLAVGCGDGDKSDDDSGSGDEGWGEDGSSGGSGYGGGSSGGGGTGGGSGEGTSGSDDDSCTGERQTVENPIDGDGYWIGIEIESESDIESIRHCVDYEGIIRVEHQDWLTDIDLPLLETVDGLEFHHNDALTHLDGLSNLRSINNTFGCGNNASLETLRGLSSLETVGHGLVIWRNDMLCLGETQGWVWNRLGLDMGWLGPDSSGPDDPGISIDADRCGASPGGSANAEWAEGADGSWYLQISITYTDDDDDVRTGGHIGMSWEVADSLDEPDYAGRGFGPVWFDIGGSAAVHAEGSNTINIQYSPPDITDPARVSALGFVILDAAYNPSNSMRFVFWGEEDLPG
jgi:hypothetical protein